MSEANQQNVSQKIGSNTGQAQAIAAGGDVNANQSMNPMEGVEGISQENAVELLTKIEELIKTANLPSEVVQEATKYVGKAKEEAEEKEPQQPIVLSQLDRATNAIKKLDTTASATSDFISKLKPLFVKLAGWLGVAVNHFFG